MITLITGNTIAVNEYLDRIVKKPEAVLQTLRQPDDFSFKFWTHMANLVLENLKAKNDKDDIERCYCQVAYILGYYIVYQKNILRKEKQKKQDLEQLNVRLKKAPYAYTREEIYGFIDKSGIPYLKKYSKKLIDAYLDEQTLYNKNMAELPAIIRMKTGEKTEYFLHKNLLAFLFIKKLNEASQRIKEDLKEKWLSSIKHFQREKSIGDDLAFIIELEERVKEGFPLLDALIHSRFIGIARKELKIPENIKNMFYRCFNADNKLYTINILLDLNRKSIMQELKYLIPFYHSIPIINILVYFLKTIFGRKEKKELKDLLPRESAVKTNVKARIKNNMVNQTRQVKESPVAASSRMSPVEYKKAVHKLKGNFVPKSKTIEESLGDLAKKWNPLYDAKAKSDLQEDVNALIRDFLRSLRKGFRQKLLNAKRIHNLAVDLANKEALQKIKRKEYLTRYIEVYIIKYLGGQ